MTSHKFVLCYAEDYTVEGGGIQLLPHDIHERWFDVMHAHFILLDAEVDEFETELEWNRMQLLLLCNIHGKRLELIINASFIFMDAEGDDEI